MFESAWFYYCFHNEFFSCHPNNYFIFKIQVVSRAVGLLESDEKVIKLMSKSCPLHLLLCGRYCSFHTSLRKVRFNLEEKIVRTFSKIPIAMVYNVS